MAYDVFEYYPHGHYRTTRDDYEVHLQGPALQDSTDEPDGAEGTRFDGGHQIDDTAPEALWFWYDPAADMILQEEIEPYDVVGLFEDEDAANRFVLSYAGRYGLDDVSHLEKYRADLTYEGQGPVLDDTDTDVPSETTDQAEFDDVLGDLAEEQRGEEE